MKTKLQKTKQIEDGLSDIQENETVIFTDFTGVKVNETNALRSALDDVNAKFRVFKKKLLRVVFQKKELGFDPESFDGQLGVVFSSRPLYEVASPVYKFAKQNKMMKILGGFELKNKKFISGKEIEVMGQLPSRDVLIAQVVSTIAGPIRSFLYVLSEKSKKS